MSLIKCKVDLTPRCNDIRISLVWVMITVFPIIVVMSAAPGAGWGDQATRPWPAGLQTALPRPDHPRSPQNNLWSNVITFLQSAQKSPVHCHAMLVRWGWPLPFLRQFISLYDVIWYQKQALYCPLLCRAVQCHQAPMVGVMWNMLWRVLCVVTWRNVASDIGPRPEMEGAASIKTREFRI